MCVGAVGALRGALVGEVRGAWQPQGASCTRMSLRAGTQGPSGVPNKASTGGMARPKVKHGHAHTTANLRHTPSGLIKCSYASLPSEGNLLLSVMMLYPFS